MLAGRGDHGDQYVSPVTDTEYGISYAELQAPRADCGLYAIYWDREGRPCGDLYAYGAVKPPSLC